MVNIWVSEEIRKTIKGLAGLKQSITKEECSAGEIIEFLLKVYYAKLEEMNKKEKSEFLGWGEHF